MTAQPDVAVARAAAVEAPWRRILGDFLASRLAVAGLAVLVAILLGAALAPWIAPQNPYDLAALDLLDGRLPPGSRAGSGMVYWLGTDDQGRDMLSAILFGLRTSLLVGAASVAGAMLLGTTAGLVAAYVGGRVESVLMRLVDLQLSFPAILVALVLVALLGKGVDKIIIALVVVQWSIYARTARGAALAERNKEYVEAARCLALSDTRILFRHLLPNCLPPLMVVMTVQVATATILEATLSFLGIGLPITEPSLGLLVANGFAYLMSGQYWISFFPGVALLVTIVAINLVGDRLRDVLNPRFLR
jgi:peptide/nickel transport system permease protein